MEKKRIQIGLVYSGKVGGTFLPVRIVKSLGHGRYEGASLPSGKTVKISTDNIKGDGETIQQWEARRKPKEPDAPAPTATVKKEKTKPVVEKKNERKASGLDAAAQILAEAGEPLSTKEMVEQMLKKGYWQTSGKTPSATIYAAILREISVKGEKSRFRKTGRGRFELTEFGKEM